MEMTFSSSVKDKAIITFSNEFAWKLEDVFDAITELADSGYAILGGDVWAVTSKKNGHVPLTYIDPSQIAVGIIKGQDNNDYVFNWHCNKIAKETWQEYVKRSSEDALTAIRKLNAERSVTNDFKEAVYYNLVYADKNEHESLR